MALRLTIDIFSGRPNPTVVITGLEERELLDRLASPRPGRGTRAEGQPRRAPRLPPSTLGYRGVVIESTPEAERRGRRATAGPRPPGPVRVVDGFVYGRRDARPARDTRLDEFICGSVGPFRRAGLGPGFFERAVEEIDRSRRVIARYPWRKWPWPLRPVCPCAPLWEPAWWNDGGQIQWNNNCYNYGTNYRSDTFAQPGLASGAMYSALTCAEVKAGAIADALVNSPSANNKCPAEGHLVALVVGPGWDFHWYRKGRNGRWTHKPGNTPATNLDNSGNLITDPRTADRNGYTDFCTFMVVMHGHVKIE
jgi:hypothetical protein